MSKDEKIIYSIWFGAILLMLSAVLSTLWLAMERGLWITLVNLVAQFTVCLVMLCYLEVKLLCMH